MVNSFDVAIVGSRSFSDYEFMCEKLKGINFKSIISGGARGADKLAERYAKEHDIELHIFLADWEGIGNYAGLNRNLKMIEWCDMVVAFWDGESKGTAHMTSNALKKGKLVRIYNYNKKTLF